MNLDPWLVSVAPRTRLFARLPALEFQLVWAICEVVLMRMMSVDILDRVGAGPMALNLPQDDRLWRARTSDDCIVVSIHSGLRDTWLEGAAD
jgi:hypothetical protein